MPLEVLSEEILTVIIPCFNEERSIRGTVRDVLIATEGFDLNVELLLMDDGSTDGTAGVMREIEQDHASVQVHVNATNLGVGRTVLNAYRMLPGHHWATVAPGDNEIIFKSLTNHLSVRHDFDIVLGFLQNGVIRPVVRRMASDAFTQSVKLLYGYPYQYLNGLKLYRISAFKGLDVVSSGHGFNAELLAKALLRDPTLRIGEVPFLARGRASGASKAFRPGNVAQAVFELYRGYSSVVNYRNDVIASKAMEGVDE